MTTNADEFILIDVTRLNLDVLIIMKVYIIMLVLEH
jgi:hypothetical protein